MDVPVLPEDVAEQLRSLLLEAAARSATGEVELRVQMRGRTVSVEVRDQGSPSSEADGFAGWFRRGLARRGMSQRTAAERLGVSVRTVNRWARGSTHPRLQELTAIRRELGELPEFLTV